MQLKISVLELLHIRVKTHSFIRTFSSSPSFTSHIHTGNEQSNVSELV
jgi:hypothetical protein